MKYLTKEHILDLDDIPFLEWCKTISKEKCPQIKDQLTLKMVPKLREIVIKYYAITIEDIIPPKKSSKKSSCTVKYPSSKKSSKKSSKTLRSFSLDRLIQTHGYMYSGNTCYMDSLFTTIFFDKKSSFYQNIINFSDSDIDREPYEKPYNYYKTICSANSKINTKDALREYVKKIRDQLREDITKVNQGHETVTCTLLRNKFKECLTDMNDDPYNIANLFSLIGDLFPKIKITYKSPYSDTTIKTTFLQLSEYLAFNDINFLPHLNDHLVFYNDGVVRGSDLSESKIVGEFYIGNPINFTIKIEDYVYELTGLIILEGLCIGKESGGAHYVSYFKKNVQWYYYNDIKDIDRIEKIDVDSKGSTKHQFFKEQNYSFPEMYFYSKRV